MEANEELQESTKKLKITKNANF